MEKEPHLEEDNTNKIQNKIEKNSNTTDKIDTGDTGKCNASADKEKKAKSDHGTILSKVIERAHKLETIGEELESIHLLMETLEDVDGDFSLFDDRVSSEKLGVNSTASEDNIFLKRIKNKRANAQKHKSESGAETAISKPIGSNREEEFNYIGALQLATLMCLVVAVMGFNEKMNGSIKSDRTSKGSPNIQNDQFLSFLLIDVVQDKNWADEGRKYSIASMYGMPDLKNRSSSKLQSSIDDSNAWVTLILANVYEDQKLKESAELFLKTTSNETLDSETLKEKMQSKLVAAAEKYMVNFETTHFPKEE